MTRAFFILLAAALHAHEIGTTRVTVTFHDRDYAVEIVTDAASLDEKLAATGLPFESRVRVSFDGEEVLPAVHRTGGVIRLTGAIRTAPVPSAGATAGPSLRMP